MTTIYLAGPMTGVKDYNFPLFFEVEHELHCQGYRVENPAKNNGDTLSAAIADAQSEERSWADYMRLDLVRLAKADAVCLLPGWHNSRGARLERYIATELNMPVWFWVNGALRQDIGVHIDLREVAA